MQTALDKLFDRLEIEPEGSWSKPSAAAGNIFYKFIKDYNGTTRMMEIITDILQKGFDLDNDKKELGNIRNILVGSGYDIQFHDGKPVIYPSGSTITRDVKQPELAWLDRNAPNDTLDYLKRAKDNLSNGKWQESLSDCRLALESLTSIGNFSDGITELVNLGIIQEGDGRNRRKDAELLRIVYGFCSTFGSHTLCGGDANLERATLGILMTESSLSYLVRLIQNAKKTKSLTKWK